MSGRYLNPCSWYTTIKQFHRTMLFLLHLFTVATFRLLQSKFQSKMLFLGCKKAYWARANSKRSLVILKQKELALIFIFPINSPPTVLSNLQHFLNRTASLSSKDYVLQPHPILFCWLCHIQIKSAIQSHNSNIFRRP